MDLLRVLAATCAGSPPACTTGASQVGDKVLIHSRQLPRDGAGVVRLRHRRRGRRHHQHPQRRRAEIDYFADHDRLRRRHHPAAVRASSLPSRARAAVDRGDRRQQRRRRPTAEQARSRASRRSTRSTATRPTARAARRSRCCRSGSCSPRARRHGRRRSCTPTPTCCGRRGPGRRTSTCAATTVYLIYLPFFHVNAQSWSIWIADRCRRDGRAAAEVVDQQVLGSVVAKHDITHISLMPFVFPAMMGQERPAEQAADRRLRADRAGARADARRLKSCRRGA